jgi:mannose-6-phosphate isomerase-like protein (cupin superfamily)
MVVDDAERDVSEGDLVFVPPNALHGIQNTGKQTLTYLSASTPTFGITALYDALLTYG